VRARTTRLLLWGWWVACVCRLFLPCCWRVRSFVHVSVFSSPGVFSADCFGSENVIVVPVKVSSDCLSCVMDAIPCSWLGLIPRACQAWHTVLLVVVAPPPRVQDSPLLAPGGKWPRLADGREGERGQEEYLLWGCIGARAREQRAREQAFVAQS